MGKYKLADVVAEIAEKHPSIVIEAGEDVFEVAPPQLWSDEIIENGTDPVATARLLLGERYDAFVAAGGSAIVLAHILQQEAGVSVGESLAS